MQQVAHETFVVQLELPREEWKKRTKNLSRSVRLLHP